MTKIATAVAVGASAVGRSAGGPDACPYIPGKRYVDWQLEDSSGQSLKRLRAIRDQIGRLVEDLVRELSANIEPERATF